MKEGQKETKSVRLRLAIRVINYPLYVVSMFANSSLHTYDSPMVIITSVWESQLDSQIPKAMAQAFF